DGFAHVVADWASLRAELGLRNNRPSLLDHLGELMVIIRPALGTLLRTYARARMFGSAIHQRTVANRRSGLLLGVELSRAVTAGRDGGSSAWPNSNIHGCTPSAKKMLC